MFSTYFFFGSASLTDGDRSDQNGGNARMSNLHHQNNTRYKIITVKGIYDKEVDLLLRIERQRIVTAIRDLNSKVIKAVFNNALSVDQ
jgi:hypothetical protein